MPDREKDLINAAIRLGEAAKAGSDEEKAQLRDLYAQVKSFADSQKEKGIEIDRSAFFAAGIIFHPEISSDTIVQAAIDYVDKDFLFVKERYED